MIETVITLVCSLDLPQYLIPSRCPYCRASVCRLIPTSATTRGIPDRITAQCEAGCWIPLRKLCP